MKDNTASQGGSRGEASPLDTPPLIHLWGSVVLHKNRLSDSESIEACLDEYIGVASIHNDQPSATECGKYARGVKLRPEGA